MKNIPYHSMVGLYFSSFIPSHLMYLYDLFCSKGAPVALKIIKNIDRYREAAMSEVEVLEQLKSLNCDRR